ncbi:hypothetical protein GCM10020331_100400 [Ectobacillus funiculus]
MLLEWEKNCSCCPKEKKKSPMTIPIKNTMLKKMSLQMLFRTLLQKKMTTVTTKKDYHTHHKYDDCNRKKRLPHPL